MRFCAARVCIFLLLCAGVLSSAELIRRNLSWTLESNNDPIVQFTNEGETSRQLTLRILLGDSSYRYRSDFEVPSGENRFVRVREILQQLTQRYPEIGQQQTGLLQVEYEGLDREIKTRIVNLNPRTGVVGETPGEAPQAPVIKKVEPSVGSPAGGTLVTIVGQNFTEATIVKFGGMPAMRTLQSPETLLAVAPPHAVGTVDIELSNGKRGAKLDRAFQYQTEGPVVYRIEPEEGPSRGGSRVLIFGRNFEEGARARWNGSPLQVRYQGPDTLAIVTPPSGGGAVATLEIINPDGKNSVFADAFRYKGVPSISFVTPQTGSAAGGYTLTVQGSDFEQGSTVLINGNFAQTTFISPQALAAQVPPGESGTVDISVTSPTGEIATLQGGFLYNDPPRVRAVTATPDVIVRNTTSRIFVDASDPEFEQLDYVYRVASGSGTIVGQGNEAVFSSVNVLGRVIVEVTVYDPNRAHASGTVEIMVQ